MLLALIISLLAAALPTLVYVLVFYWADRYEREPVRLITVAFLWGSIPAIIISLVSELALGAPFIHTPGTLAADLVEGALVAPVVEELVKGLALLWIFTRRRQEFDGVLDGLMYGALIGFGFAMTENFFYFVGAFTEGGYGSLTVLIFLRAVVFGLNHAFYTSLTGIGLGLARDRGGAARTFWVWAGLAASILAHALHNLGAGLAGITPLGLGLSLFVAAGGVGLTLLTMGLAWQAERNSLQAELAGEVGTLLSADEYSRLIGRWRRPARRNRPAPMRTRLLVEFANRKRRLRLVGTQREPELAKEVEELRAQLLQSQHAEM